MYVLSKNIASFNVKMPVWCSGKIKDPQAEIEVPVLSDHSTVESNSDKCANEVSIS